MNLSNIEKYYVQTQFLYTYIWSKGNLHNGIFEKDTKNLKDAIENTNDLVMRVLGVSDGDTVLDAGCGVGGAAFHIASNKEVDLTGITISAKQIEIARKAAIKKGLQDNVDFKLENYMDTSFNDGSFDKVYGIESVCYADNKRDFIHEAYRVLSSGGRVAILDAYLENSTLNSEQQKEYDIFRAGMAVSDLAEKESMAEYLKEAGFSNVEFTSYKDEAYKSFERVQFLGRILSPVSKALSTLKIVPEFWAAHFDACISMKKLVDNGAADYGIFVADKL